MGGRGRPARGRPPPGSGCVEGAWRGGGLVRVAFGRGGWPREVLARRGGLGGEAGVVWEGAGVARPPDTPSAERAAGDIEVRAPQRGIWGPATPPAIPVARAKG